MTSPTKPAPSDEPRKGDSAFLPVVIAAGVALLVILAIAAIVIHHRGKKLIPKSPDQHPTSQVVPIVPPAITPHGIASTFCLS
jgi:cell division protein FtsN